MPAFDRAGSLHPLNGALRASNRPPDLLQDAISPYEERRDRLSAFPELTLSGIFCLYGAHVSLMYAGVDGFCTSNS
jgi:hypothetical protein